VACGQEIGVEVLQVAHDLASGLDGIALGAQLGLEMEGTVAAGAGEDRGGEERPYAPAEDGGGTVAGGQALAPAEDAQPELGSSGVRPYNRRRLQRLARL
jgi:hypothetical protein